MSLTGSLLPENPVPLTGQLEPVTPLAPLTGGLEQIGGEALDLAGLRALIEGATDEEKEELREALEIPEPVTPDPVDREEVLGLLADLSPEEREGLGIIDPLAPDPIERADILTLLGLLSDEERAALGIVGGSATLPRLAELPGLIYNTSFTQEHSARPAPAFVGIQYNAPDTPLDRLEFSVDPAGVAAGSEIVAFIASYDFDFNLTANEVGRYTLQAGDSFITMPTPGAALSNGSWLLVGLEGAGDPGALFYSTDASPAAPAAAGFVAYSGTMGNFDPSLFVQSSDAYTRLFGFIRDTRPQQVIGPLGANDLRLEAMINAVSRAIAEEPGNFEYFKALLTTDTTGGGGDGGF